MGAGVEEAAGSVSALPVGFEAAASADPARVGLRSLHAHVAAIAAELVAVVALDELDGLGRAAGGEREREERGPLQPALSRWR